MEPTYEELVKLAARKKELVESSKQQYLVNSQKRLSKIADTKFKTAFIGALSEFEKLFGFLWGYTQPGVGYTNEQRAIRQILEELGANEAFWNNLWQESRKRILDNGNNQVRALQNEIDLYTVSWNRYRMVLPVLSHKETDNGQKE
jgi:hypothetical protein